MGHPIHGAFYKVFYKVLQMAFHITYIGFFYHVFNRTFYRVCHWAFQKVLCKVFYKVENNLFYKVFTTVSYGLQGTQCGIKGIRGYARRYYLILYEFLLGL